MPFPLVTALAALPVVAIVGLLLWRHRRRRRAAMPRDDDADFEPRFPEGPGDRPARHTTVGRRIARQ